MFVGPYFDAATEGAGPPECHSAAWAEEVRAIAKARGCIAYPSYHPPLSIEYAMAHAPLALCSNLSVRSSWEYSRALLCQVLPNSCSLPPQPVHTLIWLVRAATSLSDASSTALCAPR